MLPSADLKPAHDQVIWLYVYRDFSGKPADRAAERTSIRFSLTSWPQLILVDPQSLEILGHTGRGAKSFLGAVQAARAKVKPSDSLEAVKRVRQADRRAIELEEKPGVELARKGLEDRDIVVRYRALHLLVRQDPKTITARARELLAVANDAFRYDVCEALARSADPGAARALEALVKTPANSLNPNVLRLNAVKALAACGDAGSVEVIAPFASGDCMNGLTRTAIDALATLAGRHPAARPRVIEILKKAYPPPPAKPKPGDKHEELRQRVCLGVAQHLHATLGKLAGKTIPFPPVYDEAARTKLMASW